MHQLRELADAALINAGAWTHYSRAIADALAIAGLPAVEVHLSDVENRDDWRAVSVFDGLVAGEDLRQGRRRLPRGARAARRRARRRRLMRGRGDKLEAALAARELDRMLVTDLTNVRYLTGFTGTNGACVCGPGVRLFLTDFRYTERAEAEVEGWEPVTVAADWLGGIAERLEGKVGFEDDHMSVRISGETGGEAGRGDRGGAGRRRGREAAPGQGRRGAGGDRARPRSWPRRPGAGRSSAASRAAPSATSPSPPKRRSASSAASPRSRRSSPPAPTAPCRTPSPASGRSASGELVVFDMGAKLDGYCSDGTRTFATGEPGEQGPRGLRDGAARPSWRRSRRSRPAPRARTIDTVARERDRRRRLRRGLRPRARPRRRARGPRGPAPLAEIRRRPRPRRSRHGRARASTWPASSG